MVDGARIASERLWRRQPRRRAHIDDRHIAIAAASFRAVHV
jgi:hypothetical protein